MKKIIYTIIAAFGIFGATSCADMLETESSHFVQNPELDNKTDSIFSAFGIMQAMQQLADQYFFQNEMRGELVSTTSDATTHLRNLSNFDAGTENKYDSVYLYYKVINNCNYYLQHRDTTLLKGTENVTINEFVNIAAFRAWTYLQLTSQYGDVPYITEPVTSVSQINANTASTNYKSILASQAEYMQALKNRYPIEKLDAPVYSGYNSAVQVGHPNWNNNQKYVMTRKCFVPFNVVLGDLYLEIGEYEKAATCYFDYLNHESQEHGVEALDINWSNYRNPRSSSIPFEFPLDYNVSANNDLTNGMSTWDILFSTNGYAQNEVVSYIPMAVNYTAGQTTEVPKAFGYDYYATSGRAVSRYHLTNCPEIKEVQITPSEVYTDMAYKNPFYYYTINKDPESKTTRYLLSSVNVGDGRANMIVNGEGEDSLIVYTQKACTANFILYRTTTVFMHLAEALNRLKQPELAFAVLKSGLHDGIKQYVDTAYVESNNIPQENYYIPKPAYDLLKDGSFPFLSEANKVNFTNSGSKEIVGIHFHGAGAVEDVRSPYTYKAIVEERINKIRKQFNVNLDKTSYEDEEYINAVEDLLCDEYALEFAFEGRRFSDLLRIARHKNSGTVYGANFGDTWLSKKLESKKAGITTANCYLPFK